MIRIFMATREVVGANLGIDVILLDESGSGIRTVAVVDAAGGVVEQSTHACPLELTVSLAPLPASSFPLSAVAEDCTGEQSSTAARGLTPPWGSPEVGIPVPCSALDCTNPSSPCVEARARALALRARVVDLCRAARDARDRRNELRNEVLGLFWLALTLAISAAALASIPIFGTALAIALFAAAGAAMIAALVRAPVAAEADRDLARARAAFDAELDTFRDAVADVFASCCPHCVPEDFSEPACDV